MAEVKESRLTNARRDYKNLHNKVESSYTANETFTAWTRGGERIGVDLAEVPREKDFVDINKVDISKPRDFFLNKFGNIHPNIQDYITHYAHIQGFFNISQSHLSNFFMDKGILIRNLTKNRYDFIINNNNEVFFIERYYIDSYVMNNEEIKSDNNRPIAIGIAVSKISFENDEIQHELIHDKIVLTDTKARYIFNRDKNLYDKNQKIYGRNNPYIHFDDDETILQERYYDDLEDVEIEQDQILDYIKNNDTKSLKDSFSKDTLLGKMSRWAFRHPYLTAFIIFAVTAIIVSGIAAAIVLIPGGATGAVFGGVPAAIKFVAGSALTVFVAEILGIVGTGLLFGLAAGVGTLTGILGGKWLSRGNSEKLPTDDVITNLPNDHIIERDKIERDKKIEAGNEEEFSAEHSHSEAFFDYNPDTADIEEIKDLTSDNKLEELRVLFGKPLEEVKAKFSSVDEKTMQAFSDLLSKKASANEVGKFLLDVNNTKLRKALVEHFSSMQKNIVSEVKVKTKKL